MTDEGFNQRLIQYVIPGYFTTEPLGWIFKALQHYTSEYGLRCTEIPLRDMVRRLPQDAQARYAPEVERVIALGTVVEEVYVKSELRDFIQRSMFSRMHREASELYNIDKVSAAYDLTQNVMEEIRQVRFDDVDRTFFFEDLPQRQRRRQMQAMSSDSDTFTSGISLFDEAVGGGISTGELFDIIAYAKIGKTTWLVNMGWAACMISRVPVLHFNLEGRRELVENRYEARFSGDLYDKVKTGDMDEAKYRLMVDEYRYLRGLLVIRNINDWEVNAGHLKTELEELKVRGFVPKLIVVDYMDLMRARSGADTETQHQIAAAKDLKQLANTGYAIWTGSQAQRPRKNADMQEHVVKSQDIADAYAKIRICDGYGSLNATAEEQGRDEMRLYWENYRDGASTRYLRLHNDRNRMHLAKRAEKMTFDD